MLFSASGEANLSVYSEQQHPDEKKIHCRYATTRITEKKKNPNKSHFVKKIESTCK